MAVLVGQLVLQVVYMWMSCRVVRSTAEMRCVLLEECGGDGVDGVCL
jgi:hypothetical protein